MSPNRSATRLQPKTWLLPLTLVCLLALRVMLPLGMSAVGDDGVALPPIETPATNLASTAPTESLPYQLCDVGFEETFLATPVPSSAEWASRVPLGSTAQKLTTRMFNKLPAPVRRVFEILTNPRDVGDPVEAHEASIALVDCESQA